MNKKIILITTVIFVLGVLFVISCTKDTPRNITVTQNSGFLINKDFAKQLAGRIPKLFKSSQNNPISRPTSDDSNIVGLTRPIENGFTIDDKNGIPALYVFNYSNDSGFAVISADLRYDPVCAYADHGNIQDDTVPSMLINWFQTTIENIEIVRDGRYDNTDEGYSAWYYAAYETNSLDGFNLQIGTRSSDPRYPDPVNSCPPWFDIMSPVLLPCTWGEECTYNEECPDMGCTYSHEYCIFNTKASTGCVATALAQIMRYWEFPAGYDYNSMPAAEGNPEVQRLMKDVGAFVGTNYSCNESSAPESNIAPALSGYGYTVDYHSSYNNQMQWYIKSNLDAGMPVILGGCRTETSQSHWFGIWHTYTVSQCHEWVADGYRYVGDGCWHHILFHLNWGWHEVDPNYPINDYIGYYLFKEWNVLGSQYQYANSVFLDIHP